MAYSHLVWHDRRVHFWVFFKKSTCCSINGHPEQYMIVDTIFNYRFHFGLPGACPEDFWCPILWCARDSFPCRSTSDTIDKFCKAIITELDINLSSLWRVCAIRNKHILRFQISMHNTVFMQAFKTIKQLPEHILRLKLVEGLLIQDFVEELSSSTTLHDQHQPARGAQDIVEAYTILLRYFSEYAHLAHSHLVWHDRRVHFWVFL